jgi:class 3 adenylate cyclase
MWRVQRVGGKADAKGMRAALAAHDEVLCKAIEAHGGWLFKHTGDGVCAAFASPRSAVDAAVTAQRELESVLRERANRLTAIDSPHAVTGRRRGA